MKRILISGIFAAAVILSACSSGGDGKAGEAPGVSTTQAGAETAAGASGSGAETTETAAGASGAAAETPASSGQAQKQAAEPLILDSNEALKAARISIYEEMCEEAKLDADRTAEVEAKSMTYGEATMRYSLATVGEDSGDGYPVYIALHGGGEAEKELNDSQWVQMQLYYYDVGVK